MTFIWLNQRPIPVNVKDVVARKNSAQHMRWLIREGVDPHKIGFLNPRLLK